ncbi:MAG: 50S ribosomal protein L29 [Deltaproteobacteria bacterium]|nr:50S ribosomal protein L29 [Deltaproteobacteria bacterium]
MTPNEIREKSSDEIITLEKELREELLGLKMKHATGQLEKSHRISQVKRDIAKVLTIKNEKVKNT